MLRRVSLPVSAIALALAACSLAQATMITVKNNSFEDPNIGAGAYQLGAPDWTQSAATSLSGIVGNPYPAGTTYNVTNMDGVQFGFVGCQNNGTVDGANGALSQLLASNYTVGTSYELTVALAKCGGASPYAGPNQQVLIGLYWDNAGVIAPINTTTATIADLTWTMKDFHVSLPTVLATDAYKNKAIGIWIAAKFVTGNNAYFAVDNVRLEATTISTPEPTGMVMLISGLLGLAAYAWRKRK